MRDYEFTVYNRWGEVIYVERGATEDDVIGWDGTYLGADMISGTYPWSLTYYDELTGESIEIQGNVTLIR